MNVPPADLEAIFSTAVELDSPEQRRAYLDEACAGHPELRPEVERLLESHRQAPDFLETPAVSTFVAGDDDSVFAEQPGSVIGPYTLLDEIGEGGMGIVFLAEQLVPVKRRVALKIIKPGMDTRRVIARFQNEREALALLDHPNIARILDAGVTESERPYFVMELVDGVPITDYCDSARLSPRDRLKLLIVVCRAIQHAHQNGIIHRDIKPSNVLIAFVDGTPVPKVIDFGIAKATDHDLTERSLHTQAGDIVGTPRYMSPEQAGSSAAAVDTRTDVYSLGVLFYELLTGTTPLQPPDLENAALSEIIRRVKEDDAPRPSSRIVRSRHASSIAASRGIEPAQLARLVKGELDWIALKALEKDRNRRYASANDLARDLERFLGDRPVEAVPPSASYLLRKFTGKHRVALLSTAAVFVLLAAATTISLWQAIRATREQTRARRSDQDARAVLQFFREKVLAAARPQGKDGGLGHDVKLYEAIDEAESKIASGFAARPAVEAAIRETLGATYIHLGRPVDAIKQHECAVALREESLGPDDPETLESMHNLAVAYRLAGRAALAVPLHEREIARCEARFGRDHPETLASINNLAVALRHCGRLREAVAQLEEVFQRRTAKLGPDHKDTLTTLNNLAVTYRLAGRFGDAAALHKKDLQQTLRRSPANSLEVGTIKHNLAASYLDSGRAGLAVNLFDEVVKLRTEKLGPDHQDTRSSTIGLAAAYHLAGRTADAMRLLESGAAIRAGVRPDDPVRLQSSSSLALIHADSGRVDVALPMLEEVMRRRNEKLGSGHPETLKTMNDLAGAYLEVGRWADAERLLRPCLERRENLEARDWRCYLTMSQLGASLAGEKKYAEAQPFLLTGHDGMLRHEQEIPAYRKKELATAGLRVVNLFETLGKTQEAATWRRTIGAGSN